jgi:Putative transposase
MALRSPSGAVARPVLSRRGHAAKQAARHRLAEQARGLRPPDCDPGAALAIAANPRRLGARIGITAVLHTWGSTLTHHPHVHMIVPGGGISLDGSRWVACRSDFLVHVNLLARLFSGKMLGMLTDAHDAGQLTVFNAHAGLSDKTTFKRFIAPLRRIKCRVGGDVAIPTPHR